MLFSYFSYAEGSILNLRIDPLFLAILCETQSPPPTGPVQFGYFVNWGIYARKFFPWDVPVHSLTHILYSFADVRPDSGEVFLTDAWADEQIRFTDPSLAPTLEANHAGPLDNWNDDPAAGPQLFGTFKRFAYMKQANRHLKLLLSIGGWTFSPHFWPTLSSPQNRDNFARSAVQLLEDYGLDGIDSTFIFSLSLSFSFSRGRDNFFFFFGWTDTPPLCVCTIFLLAVDWEYPNDQQQAAAYVQLLGAVRQKLDESERKHQEATGERPHFYLTVAVPAMQEKISILDVPGMNRFLDCWNIMSYDYAGSWSPTTGHQAALFGPGGSRQGISGAAAVDAYVRAGVDRHKLVFGLPLYGRSFASTAGFGAPFQGTGAGSFEQGVWDLRDLPRPNSQVTVDPVMAGAGCYEPGSRTWTSFDSPQVAATKAQFIRNEGLAGAMYWELSGDYRSQDPSGQHAPMVPGVASILGPLDQRPNCITYPFSKWENLRQGFRA